MASFLDRRPDPSRTKQTMTVVATARPGPHQHRPSDTSPAPDRAAPRRGRSARIDAAAAPLLARLAGLPPDGPDRARVRIRLVELYLPLAEHTARRFRDKGGTSATPAGGCACRVGSRNTTWRSPAPPTS